MDPLLVALGIALLAIAYADIFKTTLTLHGAGPLTARVASGLWAGVLAVHRRRRVQWLLAYTGPAIAIATVFGWLLLQWAAWALIFNAGSPGIVSSQTGEPADVTARIYFAGYTLFTLGLGDYQPTGALWQILTAICVGTGFLTVSLSATYLIPVVSAASKKREAALYINSLGESPTDILVTCWNGKDFSALEARLSALAPLIIQVAEQHRVYPVLHYFHTPRPKAALPLRMAALAEAVNLLACGVAPDLRLPRSTTAPLAEGMEAYLDYLSRARVSPADHPPALPSLAPLRAAQIPVIGDGDFERAMALKAEQRRLLLAIVEDAGWQWPEMCRGEAQTKTAT